MKKRMLWGMVVLVLAGLVFVYRPYRGEIREAYRRIEESSHVLVTDNGTIEYGIQGDGEPVLMIHGAGGGYDQGLLLGQAFFGDGHQLIAVSRFGYLGSPLDGDGTVERQARLYADLLNHLEIGQVMVCGISAGGPSALQFAHDHPERSRGLVLVSAVTRFMGDDIPVGTKLVNAIQKTDVGYWLVARAFRTQFLALIGIPGETYRSLNDEEKGFADAMLETMHPMSPRRPGNIHEAAIRPLSGDAMAQIAVPALLLHAEDDSLVDVSHARYAHEHLGDSRFVLFDSGGHGMATELQAIRGHIREFAGNPGQSMESSL